MCESCIANKYGPTRDDVPDNVEEVSAMIGILYETESTGGPLHVVLDDFNLERRHLEPWEKQKVIQGDDGLKWVPDTDNPWPDEILLLAHRIASRLRRMTKKQRAATLAVHYGMDYLLDSQPRPERKPIEVAVFPLDQIEWNGGPIAFDIQNPNKEK
jgi:hypothetical protein